MGVIQRQGFASSIIGYIGVVIGGVSTVLIYPKALEMYGLYQFLYDTGIMLGIFVMMGSGQAAVRFFPQFEDKSSGHQGFLTWLLMVNTGVFLLLLLLFPILRGFLDDYVFSGEKQKYAEFAIYLLPFTFTLALINLFKNYTANFRKIAVPTAFDQLTIKITLPFIILMYVAGWIDAHGVVVGTLLSFAFVAAGMMGYLIYLGEWKLTRPAILKDLRGLKEYSRYSFYVLLAGIGSHIAFRIDTVMVAGMIQFQAAGVYAIGLRLSEVILKPFVTLSGITGPIISQHIARSEWKEVDSLYKKSSLNMTVIGLGLFLLIWSVLPELFEIMPNTAELQKGMYVVFFLGMAQIVDMMTGINNEIIAYSRYYRVTLIFTLTLAVLTIVFNLLFIPLYGLAGAAMATFLSMTIYNFVKLVFIRVKFGIYPFTRRILPAIGFAALAWLITRLVPETPSPFIDIVLKGGLFTGLYGFAVIYYEISPELNGWLRKAWTTWQERRRKS